MSKSTLDALRSSLGVSAFPTHDFDAFGFRWTVRDVLPEEVEYAWAIVDKANPPLSQRPVTFSLALFSCGVCRINDEPVYDVFNTSSNDHTVVDSNLPPLPLRRDAIAALFQFLRSEVPNKIVMQLFMRFRDLVNPLGADAVPGEDEVETPVETPESDSEAVEEDTDPLG